MPIEEEKPPATPCPICSKPTLVIGLTQRVRRGERDLEVAARAFQCASGCRSRKDRTKPLQFQTSELMRINEAEIREAWVKAFDTILPPVDPKPPATRWVAGFY